MGLALCRPFQRRNIQYPRRFWEELVVFVGSGNTYAMSDDNDVTQEEDVIEQDERSRSGPQATSTDFSKISFFVDDATQDESIDEDEETTDSFDAIDHTDEEVVPDDSLKTLDSDEDD